MTVLLGANTYTPMMTPDIRLEDPATFAFTPFDTFALALQGEDNFVNESDDFHFFEPGTFIFAPFPNFLLDLIGTDDFVNESDDFHFFEPGTFTFTPFPHFNLAFGVKTACLENGKLS